MDVSLLSASSRPVLLATMEVPFDDGRRCIRGRRRRRCGQQLIVANVVEIPLGPMCVAMGYGTLDPSEEDAARLRAPAELAHAFGVEVERLRVRSPHPIDALLELVAEREPGLLVFGPDRARAQAAHLPKGGEEDPRARLLPRLARRLSARRLDEVRHDLVVDETKLRADVGRIDLPARECLDEVWVA